MALTNNGPNHSNATVDNGLYEDTITLETNIVIIIPTIFALVILVGLVGNILVILTVLLNNQMRNSTNVLILNLAVSDILFLTFCVPFTAAAYVQPAWIFAAWWCGMLNYLQFVSGYATVWTLVLIAIDRYLAIVFPVKSRIWRSNKNAIIALSLLWAIICFSCIPIYLVHEVFSYSFMNENRTACGYLGIIERRVSSYQVLAYFLSFNICGYLAPLGITCFLYCFMVRTLRKRSRPGTVLSRDRRRQSQGAKKDERGKKKVTWMVSAVTITFALCWLPLNICFGITGVNYGFGRAPPDKEMIIFQIFGQCLAYTNSCLNPILYTFLSEHYRSGFRKIIGVICDIVCCRSGRTNWRNNGFSDRSRNLDHKTAHSEANWREETALVIDGLIKQT